MQAAAAGAAAAASSCKLWVIVTVSNGLILFPQAARGSGHRDC